MILSKLKCRWTTGRINRWVVAWRGFCDPGRTLGSIAATGCVDFRLQYCVGLELTPTTLRVKDGFVYEPHGPCTSEKNTRLGNTNYQRENGAGLRERITLAVIDRR